jgi:hypothetical protein
MGGGLNRRKYRRERSEQQEVQEDCHDQKEVLEGHSEQQEVYRPMAGISEQKQEEIQAKWGSRKKYR